ncbi:MAG: helix-turn-helix transcriptional regulator [Clostridia bacterium]|nr:helix-turn-helix transcriptional regulator [Clostridia bacterium]
MKLGEKILNYRKKLGLSQEELGDKVGVSRQTVSKWEIGQTIPELEKMILLAKEFETTIDELVRDEENMQDNVSVANENKVKKFVVENFKKYNKIIKIIIVILIMFMICFIGKVAYRIILLNKFEDEILKFKSSYYTVQNLNTNYRIEISNFKTDRGISFAAENMTTYYVKNNIRVKWYIKEDAGRYAPKRIEYLNYDTDEYYDIDMINKTYVKKSRADVNLKKEWELSNQNDYIVNDMLGNIEIEGWKNKVKFALDFDNKISSYKNNYNINVYSDTNIGRSMRVGENGLFYDVNKMDENNRSNMESTAYYLDLNVVVAESLTALPDLTGYTQIGN